MNKASGDQLSVLLVCPPGLSQVSLVTAVNAFSWATVVARAKDLDSALLAAEQFTPDILLVDAYSLGDLVSDLLKRIKEVNSEVLCVVLVGTSSQKARFLNDGAHIALDYSNFNRQFPQALGLIQANMRDS